MPTSKKKIKAPKRPTKSKQPAKAPMRRAAPIADGPVTLREAKALAEARSPQRAMRGQAATVPAASPASVGAERQKLAKQRREENKQRIREYKATLEIMKQRGVKGLTPE